MYKKTNSNKNAIKRREGKEKLGCLPVIALLTSLA